MRAAAAAKAAADGGDADLVVAGDGWVGDAETFLARQFAAADEGSPPVVALAGEPDAGAYDNVDVGDLLIGFGDDRIVFQLDEHDGSIDFHARGERVGAAGDSGDGGGEGGGGGSAPEQLPYTVTTAAEFQAALDDHESKVGPGGVLTIVVAPGSTISTAAGQRLVYALDHDLVIDGDSTSTLTGGGSESILSVFLSGAGTVEIAGDMVWEQGEVGYADSFGFLSPLSGPALLAGNTDVVVSGAAVFRDHAAATPVPEFGTGSGGFGAITTGGDVLISGDATFEGNVSRDRGSAVTSTGGSVTVSGQVTFAGNTNAEGTIGFTPTPGTLAVQAVEVPLINEQATFAGVSAGAVVNWADPGGAGTDGVQPAPGTVAAAGG